jgi:hypothetical protein
MMPGRPYLLKEIIKPKIRAKGFKELDAGKSTGVPT